MSLIDIILIVFCLLIVYSLHKQASICLPLQEMLKSQKSRIDAINESLEFCHKELKEHRAILKNNTDKIGYLLDELKKIV